MKHPTLLLAALMLVAAGAGTAIRADEPARGTAVRPPEMSAPPRSRTPVPAATGLSRCCPQRLPGVGIVRTGGLAGTSPNGREALPLEPCDACADWEACARQLEQVGASMQTMPLRNGLMHVFTADTPAGIRVVQAALGLHFQRMSALISAGANVRLCPTCRALRGAALSGKLSREIVKIEGGCITLTTSPDPAVVARMHTEAGIPAGPRPRF